MAKSGKAQIIANWVLGPVMAAYHRDGEFRITPKQLYDIIKRTGDL